MINFIWLEQSGKADDISHRLSILQELNVPFFRYNWKIGDQDAFANVSAPPKLSWSKGREALFFQARSFCKSNPDFSSETFYIFVDDDITFDDGLDCFLQTLRKFLTDYKCDLIVPYSQDRSHFSRIQKSLIQRLASHFPVCVYDMQLMIMSARLCDLSFPVSIDGGHGSMWDAFFKSKSILNSWPQCLYTSVQNTNTNLTAEYGGTNTDGLTVLLTFKPYLPKLLSFIYRVIGFRYCIQLTNLCLFFKSQLPFVHD